MSPRITHANPKGLELGTSEQQIVLAKDGVGAKKPTDFGPDVSTFKIKISWSSPLLSLVAGVCQVLVCFSRHLLLEQRGDVGTEAGDSLSLTAAPRRALPSGPHPTTRIRFTSEMLNPCPHLGLQAEGRAEGPGRACRCSGLQEGAALSQSLSCSPALLRVPILPQPSSFTFF